MEREYKINIDPKILELLGPNLYTNIYYVLAELIANAYDANAKNVYLISSEDKIIVEDDGRGMSYERGEVKKFLNVAQESRSSEKEAFVEGSDRTRRKMGRKGVGKLAALSVSDSVEVNTVSGGEKSGFILSRSVRKDGVLEAISPSDIEFYRITDNGTSIVMRNPRYSLNKTFPSIKKNLLKIFPMVGEDFKIHIHVGSKTAVIDSFEKELVKELGCLITFGSGFYDLAKHFNSGLSLSQKDESSLCKPFEEIKKTIEMKDKFGKINKYNLVIKGWVGAYRTSRGKRAAQEDFPDNFISIISNGKLGEFNILPQVGKNSLSEVYIVGQLHIDLFEHSDLPDIALSNRQGYKTDDVRYQEAEKKIKSEVLPKIINLRGRWAALNNSKKDSEKHKKNIEHEKALRESVNKFKNNAVKSAVRAIGDISKSSGEDYDEYIEQAIFSAINKNLPDMGFKSTIDSNKKKLLISHASKDKILCDFLFDLLKYCGVSESEIIYTSCDSYEARIPEGESIFDYLREFFVESISTEKVYIIYVTSENLASSWAALSEVGAGWIVRSRHKIISLNGFCPKEPLDVRSEWSNMIYDKPSNEIRVNERDVDVLTTKIMSICSSIGHDYKDRDALKNEIRRRVVIS